jgi:cellulose synthase/poly-beta-1,6-N-acetylglucosamine synthase-like glycosyltransferase
VVRLRIRTVACIALAASLAYLTWRATATIEWSAWWLALPLLALEAHAAAGLALFTFSLWDLDATPPVEPRRSTEHRVAILIPTANESLEVLLPAVAAAVALEPAHHTWVLDDRDRPEVRRLALDLGARYLAGPEPPAGAAVDADLLAVLDPDHVAAPGFLTHTLGYFDDPRVAVVQTPRDFYNLDSFEHHERGLFRGARSRRFSEQALLHRVLQPGKNRWGAALWWGTGAVVRTAALRDVGGLATGTATEELHTTIRLHRRGWRSVYHNEVLARGLACSDADQYQAERLRWGIGAMQVLRAENPLAGPGLRPAQRLAHAITLLGWFDAWRLLGYLLVPPLVLLTGAVPIRTDPSTFVLAFTIPFALQRLALIELARDRAPQVLSTVFELIRMPVSLRATLALFGRRGWASAVPATPRRRALDREARPAPPVLRLVQWLCALSAGFAALTLAGLTPLTYRVPWAVWGALAWLAVNAVLVTVAVRRVRAERFAGERRAGVRFGVDFPGRLGDYDCEVVDLSLVGAGVRMSAVLAGEIELGDAGELSFEIGAQRFSLAVTVRSRRLRPDRTLGVGVEFGPDQDHERARLALALFHSEAAVELVPSSWNASAAA